MLIVSFADHAVNDVADLFNSLAVQKILALLFGGDFLLSVREFLRANPMRRVANNDYLLLAASNLLFVALCLPAAELDLAAAAAGLPVGTRFLPVG